MPRHIIVSIPLEMLQWMGKMTRSSYFPGPAQTLNSHRKVTHHAKIMKQTILTVITEIDPSRRAALEQVLAEISLDLLHNAFIPFASVNLLHFASFVIADDKISPPLLIFESNFDGTASDYFDELISVAGNGIHKIYECCSNYPAVKFQPETLKQFLLSRIVRPNAFHIGNVGRPAADIRTNQQLREKLENHLDVLFSNEKPTSFTPRQLHENIVRFVKDNLRFALENKPGPHQTFLEKLIPKLRLGIFGIIGIALAIALFPLTILAIVVLRRKENVDRVMVQLPSVSELERFSKMENRITQNHLASITQLKPGKFRLVLLKLVLFAVNLLARTSTSGKLSGITSIHFAHWSIINHGKQLLFLSNYDGSWSSYLDDFIDKASPGLTGIWSNTQGFPHTRFLVADGARDESGFKAFARSHQTPSLVWYSAYGDLTVQNIDKDSSIREKIFTSLPESGIEEWLTLY